MDCDFPRELDARAEFMVNASGGVTRLVVHLPLRDDLSAERVPRGP